MCEKILLIPAYKPKNNFIELIESIDLRYFKIVVVNDGSGEEFKYIFQEIKKYADVIQHEKNKGKGEAIKTGLKFIKEKYEKKYVVVTIDCDMQHRVKDAEKACEEALKNRKALIIGKRNINKKVPIKSRIGNWFASCIYFGISKKYLQDTQTGLRAFSDELIDFLLNVEGKRYEYEMNVLLNCFSKNIEIKEINIETVYFEENQNTHFNSIKDTYKILKSILKFSMSSLISFFIDYVLYSLFITTTRMIEVSNISARVISSIVNYNLNKRIVFKKEGKSLKMLIKYFLLVIFILSINTIVLKIFIKIIGINEYIAKILVETILFILSYIVQKNIIFKK